MRPARSKWWDRESDADEGAIAPFEHRLTMHLERAHLLAEQAQRSNDAVQHDIERTREIVDEVLATVSRTPRRWYG
jgi:hypothetical protein